MRQRSFTFVAVSALAGALAGLLVSSSARAEERGAGGERTITREQVVPLGDGCRYRSEVKGTVTPVGDRFEPNLSVSSVVSCPGAADVQMKSNAVAGKSLAQDELERAVEKQATVESEGTGERCTYAPDFNFDGRTLSLSEVERRCGDGEPTTRP